MATIGSTEKVKCQFGCHSLYIIRFWSCGCQNTGSREMDFGEHGCYMSNVYQYVRRCGQQGDSRTHKNNWVESAEERALRLAWEKEAAATREEFWERRFDAEKKREEAAERGALEQRKAAAARARRVVLCFFALSLVATVFAIIFVMIPARNSALRRDAPPAGFTEPISKFRSVQSPPESVVIVPPGKGPRDNDTAYYPLCSQNDDVIRLDILDIVRSGGVEVAVRPDCWSRPMRSPIGVSTLKDSSAEFETMYADGSRVLARPGENRKLGFVKEPFRLRGSGGTVTIKAK